MSNGLDPDAIKKVTDAVPLNSYLVKAVPHRPLSAPYLPPHPKLERAVNWIQSRTSPTNSNGGILQPSQEPYGKSQLGALEDGGFGGSGGNTSTSACRSTSELANQPAYQAYLDRQCSIPGQPMSDLAVRHNRLIERLPSSSRPTSGKISRPTSGKISRPTSGKTNQSFIEEIGGTLGNVKYFEGHAAPKNGTNTDTGYKEFARPKRVIKTGAFQEEQQRCREERRQLRMEPAKAKVIQPRSARDRPTSALTDTGTTDSDVRAFSPG